MKLDYVICTRYFHRWSLDSKTCRSLRDLPMYICKSLCRGLFNVDVIVCDCLTSWAFRCMKIKKDKLVAGNSSFEKKAWAKITAMVSF